MGRPGASLRVMTTAAGTCDRIVPSRTRATAMELPGDDRGVLVSDCLNTYDDLTPLQQKCYAHNLKKIGEALAGPSAGSAWLADLRGLLTGAMALKAVYRPRFLRVRLRTGFQWLMRRSMMLPAATWFMASETSMRAS
jgi:hypothetical protein